MSLQKCWLGLVARVRGRPAGHALGRAGERAAARWLKRRGYVILQRNLGMGRDEADIVALSPDRTLLVIVEVKTRRSDSPPPELSITREKQRFLSRLAARLLQSPAHRDRAIRFDVVCVIWPEGSKPNIRHIERAFESQLG